MSKTLYTEGDFKLVIPDPKSAYWNTYNSWIWHHCGVECGDKSESKKIWRECECRIVGHCWWCGDSIPEGLHGLWKLHNFDIIQEVG